MKRILSVGQDADLLYSRNLLLQRTGAAVFSARTEPALHLLQAQSFDLVVLCHTLEQKDLVAACRAIRRFSPRTRLLLIAGSLGFWAAPDSKVDTIVPWHRGPRALLKSAGDLLGSLRDSRPRPAQVIPITQGRCG